MRIREIICKRWFLPNHILAITLYPFIFYQGQPKKWIRKHEFIHIKQIKKIGVFKFYFLYLFYSVKYGYKNNPLEKEAYDG